MRYNYIFILFTMLSLYGCTKEDLTPNQQTEDLLKAQVWELTETKIDGVVNNLYDGLTLTFGTKTYSTTNGGDLWPSSGTWEFVGDKGDKILRDDGLAIDVVSVNASELTLSFYWDTTIYDGGREKSVKGLHVMKFNRRV